jgi:ADP-heptose:LPS heptosyltransferase
MIAPTSPPAPTFLIFRTDKIGDWIVSTPLLTVLRQAHPDAKIVAVVSPYNRIAVDGLRDVDEILTYDPMATFQKKIAFARQLRCLKPDAAFVLGPKTSSYFLAVASGAKKRGGLLMSYRWTARALAPFLLHHSVTIPRDRSARMPHQSARMMELAARMGFPIPDPLPLLQVPTDRARQGWAKEILDTHLPADGPKIALHLPDKWLAGGAWKVDDVEKLVLDFLDLFPTGGLVLTAGAQDHRVADVFQHLSLPRTLFFRDLAFVEWTSLLGAVDIVVTPDCSAVHVASALQKPVIALYDPGRMAIAVAEFGPWQTPHHTLALDSPARSNPAILAAIRSYTL